MEWTDEAIVLSARKHGENAVIADLFTKDRGRHKGIVRGGSSRRLSAALQPGSSVKATWRARLPEHLGSYQVELSHARAAAIMSNPMALHALNSVCAVSTLVLPEREPHAPLYRVFELLLNALEDDGLWPSVYVRWELGLLKELGFGLELSHCAATGVTTSLAYVSPKSGQAVCEEAALPYRDRLLPMPPFLVSSKIESTSWEMIADGLKLTGFFLEKRVLAPHQEKMPDARHRLAEKVGELARAEENG